eukprot:scaffold3126_cov136-Amphora_coffeaeformis.AAC.6
MTSAFERPSHSPPVVRIPSPHVERVVPPTTLESETEDEEVKLNCIGGIRYDESDINGFDEDEEDDSQDESQDDDDDEPAQQGVVNFVSRLVRFSPRIVKPAFSRHRRLTPPLELEEEDEEEDLQEEVGARGVALPFTDEDDDDEEDDDGVSDMEDSVSGSDADESDMEEDSDEEEDSDDEEEDHNTPTLERPILEDDYFSQEDETSVILQALEEEADEEIASLIDAVSPSSNSSSMEELYQLPVDAAEEHSESSREDARLHLIGCTQDRDGALITVPHAKRALSLDENTLHQSNGDDDSVIPTKRRRSDADQVLNKFSLGLPALTLSDTASSSTVETPRFLSPINTSSEELEEEEEDDVEEELDGQLRYELESTASRGGDQSPVPLLTPPQSPVNADACEWPSNLVVDTALTTVMTQIKPLDWTEATAVEDEEPAVHNNKGSSFTSSQLTPLFRSIHVSDC